MCKFSFDATSDLVQGCHMTTTLKVICVGDATVGKSWLAKPSAGHYCCPTSSSYEPTGLFSTFEVNTFVDGRPQHLVFWDTAGDESYDRFRPWCYSDADVFLVCYSTVDPTSLTNVYQKWIKEIRMSRPNTPIVVVGTKSDARVDHVQRCLNARSGTVVTTDQGAVFAKAAGAIFVECSALSSRGIKEVLLATTRAGRRANTEVTTPAAPTEKHRLQSFLSALATILPSRLYGTSKKKGGSSSSA